MIENRNQKYSVTMLRVQNAFTFLLRSRTEQALFRNANASKTVVILETGAKQLSHPKIFNLLRYLFLLKNLFHLFLSINKDLYEINFKYNTFY